MRWNTPSASTPRSRRSTSYPVMEESPASAHEIVTESDETESSVGRAGRSGAPVAAIAQDAGASSIADTTRIPSTANRRRRVLRMSGISPKCAGTPPFLRRVNSTYYLLVPTLHAVVTPPARIAAASRALRPQGMTSALELKPSAMPRQLCPRRREELMAKADTKNAITRIASRH